MARQGTSHEIPWCFLGLLGLGCLLMQPDLVWSQDAYHREGALRTTVLKTTVPHPVNLLTGFEPFGESRPLNPSWEGIKRQDTTVVFCHVPPHDSSIGRNKLTPAYVQQFVEMVLESWDPLDTKSPGSASTFQTGERKLEEARQKDMKEIKEFIHRYFRTWSEQDMKGYDECFLPDACIQYIDARGNVDSSPRALFVANQKDYHRRATHKAVEVPESMDIRFEAKLARVIVYWKLTAGPRLDNGYDHFTLIKQEGNWRIVNLVFYHAAKKIPD